MNENIHASYIHTYIQPYIPYIYTIRLTYKHTYTFIHI